MVKFLDLRSTTTLALLNTSKHSSVLLLSSLLLFFACFRLLLRELSPRLYHLFIELLLVCAPLGRPLKNPLAHGLVFSPSAGKLTASLCLALGSLSLTRCLHLCVEGLDIYTPHVTPSSDPRIHCCVLSSPPALLFMSFPCLFHRYVSTGSFDLAIQLLDVSPLLSSFADTGGHGGVLFYSSLSFSLASFRTFFCALPSCLEHVLVKVFYLPSA
mmetsp:Transcript_9014/g.25158  ORF Transcript_9014/g.25158 Transcript_9014/m.25158 type:complete len:214 (-) Transcript_9014:1525-2166(-)